MTRRLYIVFILTFHTTLSFACLNTYQFKIFPVGTSREMIVTVDVQIRRTSVYEGTRSLKPGPGSFNPEDEMWILYSFISTYDKNQKLISLTPLDTTFSIGKTYADTLDTTYQRGLKQIAAKYADMVYFKPEYISFCDFQHNCSVVKIQSDTISKSDYVVYDGKRYQTGIIQDTTYYAFDRTYHPESITGLYINSVRIYRSKTLTLVITHLATGHEIAMGVISPREHKPEVTITDIKKSTYEEPLLHHGYGFDIFITK